MMKLKLILTLWLAIAAIGASAQGNQHRNMKDMTTEEILAVMGVSKDNYAPDAYMKFKDGSPHAMSNYFDDNGNVLSESKRAITRSSTDDNGDEYNYSNGVKYTYITKSNWTRYFDSESEYEDQGYSFKGDYMIYMIEEHWYGDDYDYVVAASARPNASSDDGIVYIIQDIVDATTSHTRLGAIATDGFYGLDYLKTVQFRDCDAASNTANSSPSGVIIGRRAFANCPNLQQLNMMYYVEEGSNRWEALAPTQFRPRDGSILNGSPNASIYVDDAYLSSFRTSNNWKDYVDQIYTFTFGNSDQNEDGGIYSYFLNSNGTDPLSNEDWSAMLQQVETWKDRYVGLTPADLLYKRKDEMDAELWYVRLTGVIDADIAAKDGVLTVYNDIGSNYNYKTIAIGGKLNGNQYIKKVRFESSPSNVGNAKAPLKLVIEDGAFRNCSNLEEFRLFYLNNRGTNSQEALKPTDVIPGKNVFDGCDKLRIVVAASRYLDFINDANWQQYASMIVPDEVQTADFEEDAAVYGYLRRDNGQYYSNSYNEELALTLKRWENDAENFKVTDVLAPGRGYIGLDVWYVKLNKVDNDDLQALDGVLTVYNDVGTAYNYKTIAIDSMALRGNQTIKKVRFESSPSNVGNANIPMSLFIQPGAFRGCTNLEEFQVLYYNNRGSNTWESLGPKDIIPGRGAFDDCPNLRILVARNRMKEFMNDPNWAPYANKLSLADFEPDGIADGVTELTGEGIAEGGLIYDYYASEADATLMNNEKVDQMAEGLRAWEDTYQGLSVRTLLEPTYKTLGSRVWYLRVRGADADAIRNQNGVVTMYNDVGTYYNYKTICLKGNVLSGNTDLRTFKLESSSSGVGNAKTLMSFVIEDGAFKGCSNLELVDLCYWNNQSIDREQALGPKDVYVGKNVFDDCPNVTIRVAASRYDDFINDPNWKPYAQFIQPDELVSTDLTYTKNIVYSYFNKDDGSHFTNDDHMIFVDRLASWNTQYQDFAATDVLAQDAQTLKCKVYYTKVTGFDDDGKFDGNLHIYNDVHQQKFTKTIQVEAGAFSGNDKIQSITFHSTIKDAHDINYPMATVIADSAFAHCKNLKEVALYYYDERAVSPRMEYLLPTDIVPGKGCFDDCDPELKIMVAPEMYTSFINDPNWAQYKDRIVASQFVPTTYGPFKVDGVTYDYAARTLNSLPTSELTQREMSLLTILTAAAQVGLAAGIAYAATSTSIGSTAAWGHSGVEFVAPGAAVATAANMGTSTTSQMVVGGMVPEIAKVVGTSFVAKGLTGSLSYLVSIFPRMVLANVFVNDLYFAALYNMACYGTALAIGSAVGVGVQAMNNAMLKRKSSWNIGPMLTVFRDNKHTIYHVYIKDVDNTSEVKIYSDPGSVYNYKTVLIGEEAFRNKNAVSKVSFYDVNGMMTSRMYAPLSMVIPDKCFEGCTALRELDLMLNVEDGPNHRRSLGPENFILNGSNIFAGCDTTQLKIRVGKSRLNDFVNDEMWGKFRSMYIVEDDALPVEHTKAGVQYANQFELNSRRVDEKVGEHTIDYITAVGIKDSDLGKDGELRLYNDIGTFNNYHLTNVNFNAFRGNSKLRGVTFWDLDGLLWSGDAYDDLDLMLNDSCMAECPNLQHVDMLYLRTDGDNTAEHWGPDKIKLGYGVFAGSPNVKIRMDYYRQSEFLEDINWAGWSDKFLPCFIGTENKPVYKALKKWVYKANGITFDQYIDLSRITESEMAELSFANSSIESFDEFEAFGAVGLNKVHNRMFADSKLLQRITLSDSIAAIGTEAFSGCSALKLIVVNRQKPATLGDRAFDGLPDDFVIMVPDSLVGDYQAAWPQYANHIGKYTKTKKVVTLTEAGTLAQALGLEVVDYDSSISSFKLKGTYANIDSLKIIGPINGLDVAVLRTMAGRYVEDCSYNPLGHLEYLNLYNANIVYDEREICYNRKGSNDYIQGDNRVDTYMFWDCDALRTVILPKSATLIAHDAFKDCDNLETLVIGDNTVSLEKRLVKGCKSLAQVVFLCDSKPKAHEDAFDNDIPMGMFSVLGKLKNAYIGDDYYITHCTALNTQFYDEALTKLLAKADIFTMADVMWLGSMENIVEGNTDIKTIREAMLMANVETLGDHSFAGMSNLVEAGIPVGCTSISKSAFKGCSSLLNIYAANPEPPVLAENAFEDLPENFTVLVPDSMVNTYRAAWPQYKEHIGAFNPQNIDIVEVTLTEPNTLDKALGLNVTMKDHQYIKSVEGNFWEYSGLKISGPIGGKDVALLRTMAGRTVENCEPIAMSSLKYLDLYDAHIVADHVYYNTKNVNDNLEEDDVLGTNMFWQCDVLETLILPRVARKMADEACYDMANLKTLVIGEVMDYIDNNALGDLPSLENLAFLGNNVPQFHSDAFADPTLSTNTVQQIPHIYVPTGSLSKYNTTPILYEHAQEIIAPFDDDVVHKVLARHTIFTPEQMANVTKIQGWFCGNNELTSLEVLSKSRVDSLAEGQLGNMQALQRVKLPSTLKSVGVQTFSGTPALAYVDMSSCTSLEKIDRDDIGVVPGALIYLPASNESGSGVNMVWTNGDGGATCTEYVLDDSRDYLVPIAFEAATAKSNRKILKSDYPYTVCLPFALQAPSSIRIYKLSGRSTNELIFTQTFSAIEAFEPCLIIADADGAELTSGGSVTIPVSDGSAYGKQNDAPGYSMRGTLKQIDNSRAAELGAYTLQQDGKWHPVMADSEAHRAASIVPFRAYLLQNRGAQTRSIGMSLEGTTGIEQLRTIDSDGTERIYDLNGRRLSAPTKGINIINGKKVIIK